MEKQGNPNPVQAALAVPGWLLALLGFIGGVILGWFKGTASKGISGMLGMAGMSVFKGLVMTTPDRAIEWLQEAATVFRVPTGAWATFVTEVMYTLTGDYIDPAQFIEQGIGPGSRGAIEALGNAYLQPMLGLILPRADEISTQMGIRPEDGLRGANRFFGVNLEFQMKAWLLHMLGDTFSFGMWKGMKDLPNAISWSFGIGWLSWLVMGTPFRMAIADPLEVLYNQMYRPYRFSVAKVADIFWRGHKSSSWFYEQMRDLGVRDPDMEIILDMERTKMTNAEVYRLYRLGKLSYNDLVAQQRAQGHPLEDASSLAAEMTRREPTGLVEDVAKAAMKHYKDRRMSDSQLRSFLASANWTPEEQGLIIQRLNLEIALKDPGETVKSRLSAANVGRLYQKELVTRQWAEVHLTNLGWLTEEIPYFLQLYPPKEEKPPGVKEPPASLVGIVFQRGLISLDEAQRRWRELDLAPDYVNLLSVRYAPPVPAPPLPPREFSPSEVGRLYRGRVITRFIALERLEAEPIRFKEPDAVMYLDAFYEPIEEVVPPPREVPAYVVGGLYREGLVAENILTSYLVELRYSDRAIEFLLTHYAPPVPPPPVPPREFTPSEIGRLWRDHYLTTETSLGRLTGPQIKMTPDDAQMFLDAFYHPVEVVEPPPREAPASVVGSLYREGKIPLSALESHLDTLRYSPASTEFLVQVYLPPIPVPPPPPREFTPTEIGRLFSDVSITPRDAVDRLTGPQVNMTLDDSIIYLRAFYVPIDIVDIGIMYTIGTISRQVAIEQMMSVLPGLLETDAPYYLDTFF